MQLLVLESNILVLSIRHHIMSAATSTSESSLYETYMELCDQYGEIILNWADPTNEFRGYTNVRYPSLVSFGL